MPPLPTLADQIDALLPQTQCEQCGYHGCRPYAEAIADGSAAINQCPPGGQLGIERIADLLGIAALPLNPENGEEKPRTLARIIESQCIGCTKCIQVCPVDAIVGANKLMHTVVADICTGCERCVPACPVDCIVLEPMPLAQANDPAHADQARRDFQRRETRLAALQRQREAELLNRKAQVQGSGNSVLDALARARARKQDPNA